MLVEYETRFCHLLSERFPGVNIVQGDAYGLKATLAGKVPGKIATVVSSLPLLDRPERDRVELLNQSFEMMGDDGLFIQFTYGLTKSPMPMHAAWRQRRLCRQGIAADRAQYSAGAGLALSQGRSRREAEGGRRASA